MAPCLAQWNETQICICIKFGKYTSSCPYLDWHTWLIWSVRFCLFSFWQKSSIKLFGNYLNYIVFPVPWSPQQKHPIFKGSVHHSLCKLLSYISHSSPSTYRTSHLSNPGRLSFSIVSTSHFLITTFPLQWLLNFVRAVWGWSRTTFICVMRYEKGLLWTLSCHKWEEHGARWATRSRSGCVLETSLYYCWKVTHKSMWCAEHKGEVHSILKWP